MSLVAAVLVLTWLAILVLALAMAGMLVQLRQLQRDVLRPQGARSGVASAPQFQPTKGERAFVLTVDSGCEHCDDALPAFADLARRFGDVADFTVLAARSDDRYSVVDGVDLVVDGRAFHDLAPPWTPGLLVVGPGGDVLEVGPGADLAGLESWLASVPVNGVEARSAKRT